MLVHQRVYLMVYPIFKQSKIWCMSWSSQLWLDWKKHLCLINGNKNGHPHTHQGINGDSHSPKWSSKSQSCWVWLTHTSVEILEIHHFCRIVLIFLTKKDHQLSIAGDVVRSHLTGKRPLASSPGLIPATFYSSLRLCGFTMFHPCSMWKKKKQPSYPTPVIPPILVSQPFGSRLFF